MGDHGCLHCLLPGRLALILIGGSSSSISMEMGGKVGYEEVKVGLTASWL